MSMNSIAGYTDIHTHILPGVDDGSSSVEETMQMLTAAYDEGVRTIFATPHYIPGRRNAGVEHLQEIYERICREAETVLPDLNIYLGNEIYYKDNVVNDIKSRRALTLAGTDYLLVEFSTRSEFNKIFQAVRSVTEAGYRPIIAHMERYGCLYKKERLIEDLMDAGAYIQINTESLVGNFLDRQAAFCRKLLEEGYVSFLGSDCHDNSLRKPLMRQALSKLEKTSCGEQIRKIMTENVAALLENKWIR